MSYTIARIAVETGINPNALRDSDPDIFLAIIDVLNKRAQR